MEHEVFVPVVAERLREALADPARVARAIPGLHQDAGTAPVSGRLKVRVGSHSITYRGALRVVGRDDGSYTVEGDAAESRGSGSVKLALTVRLVPADGGTTVVFGGGATADGRVEELPADAVASAATRLLDRFAENLGAGALDGDSETGSETGSAASAPTVSADGDLVPPPAAVPDHGAPADDASAAVPTPSAPAEDEDLPPASAEGEDLTPAPEGDVEPPSPSVFEAEVPPPSLDPLADDELEGGELEGDELEGDELDGDEIVAEDLGVTEGLGVEDEPPAEAAHARRTMIGRSAEEVDHAPPRGRYAPVPAPETGSGRVALRWAAPAAALAVASAIVVSRALRKRR
ncbi:SRPBCC domain-containing protein [Streptomyces sp. NPDC058274]|uniref:SRPBCC domain-containing protein n=1 Tax=Streptomyces sp. NPDC058274 TaxID=3346416 RepID=UPI0036E741BE